MSYIFRTFGCDACLHEWEVFCKREDGPPNFCPNCGEAFDGDLEAVPAKVAIGGSNIQKAVDGTYRYIEQESADRAAALNAPHLKVTNIRDNLREGDVAAMPLPRNTVTNFMDGMVSRFGAGARYGFQGGYVGTGEARPTIATRDGQFVGPGHVALQGIQGPGGRTHATTRALATNTGQQNKETK